MSADVSKMFDRLFEEIKKSLCLFQWKHLLLYFWTSFQKLSSKRFYSIQEAAMNLKIFPKAACDPDNYSESR